MLPLIDFLDQVFQASGKLIARDNLGHAQRSGPVKRIDFFVVGKGEDGNGFQARVGCECFQGLKGVECLVIHVQNYCAWDCCRDFVGNVLLRSSPFDPVALRHQGVTDLGVKENVRHADKHGFLVCLVCFVCLVRIRRHS